MLTLNLVLNHDFSVFAGTIPPEVRAGGEYPVKDVLFAFLFPVMLVDFGPISARYVIRVRLG